LTNAALLPVASKIAWPRCRAWRAPAGKIRCLRVDRPSPLLTEVVSTSWSPINRPMSLAKSESCVLEAISLTAAAPHSARKPFSPHPCPPWR